MAIYKGNQKQNKVYKGGTKIGKIYKGSTLIYSSSLPSGIIIFESATPGTYTVNITSSQNYYIELVGSGASGQTKAGFSKKRYGGGSGAYVYGTQYLAKGTYTVVIGAGKDVNTNTNGENTTFNNNIAGGGKNSDSSYAGGTYSTTLNGRNGNTGGQNVTANSVYNNSSSGYGAGGYSNSSGSISGYAKIVTA